MRGWRWLGVVLSVFWFVGFGLWLRQADYDSALKVAGFENCSIVYDMQVKRYAPESSDHRQVVREFSECLNRAGARFVAPPWWKIIVTDALSGWRALVADGDSRCGWTAGSGWVSRWLNLVSATSSVGGWSCRSGISVVAGGRKIEVCPLADHRGRAAGARD
jgi:hypothetical protein